MDIGNSFEATASNTFLVKRHSTIIYLYKITISEGKKDEEMIKTSEN
jgi:hypothetical protein